MAPAVHLRFLIPHTVSAMRFALCLLLLLAISIHGGRAEVTLAPLFSDGAVLQRDQPVPVWGRADAGEKVTVIFAGQVRQATTGRDGRWIAFLDPLPVSAAGAELIVAGGNRVSVRDVVVGEVWVCSGQSNMEWPVARAANSEREVPTANFPLLRHIKIEHTVAASPADTVGTTKWEAATPQAVGGFTAVGYFFARELHQRLGIPVGIVNSSWGGTPIEAWMSPAALADPAFAGVHRRWSEQIARYPQARVDHEAQLATWTRDEAAAKASGTAAHAAWLGRNPRPRAPRGPGDRWTPAGLFNGMIHPLLPYGIRGVIWYQGEANAPRAFEYRALFTSLITSWRAHFGQGDFPFYWVNLAAFDPPAEPTQRTFAFLREAQTQALALPNTGQALAIDLGDPRDIHPTNKQEVGRRLALLARSRVYGSVVDATGPTFVNATREGTALRVRFAHVNGGLLARDQPVQSLELAGADRVFHPASARIERDTLLVSAPNVKEPVAVRYAWSNAPIANLYNSAGLPAVPFRSDDWPEPPVQPHNPSIIPPLP